MDKEKDGLEVAEQQRKKRQERREITGKKTKTSDCTYLLKLLQF